MKKLIKTAVDYAKRNPEQTKRYAKQALDTVKKYRSSSKTKNKY